MAILDSTIINGSLNATKLYDDGIWIIDRIYPVGSLYISTANVSPAILFGGTWEILPGGYCLETVTIAINHESEIEPINEGGQGYRRLMAALPNITGRRFLAWSNTDGGGTLMKDSDNIASSAIYSSRASGKAFFTANGNSHGSSNDLQLDASRCNAIYGRSNTVQPPAYRVYVWKRVG